MRTLGRSVALWSIALALCLAGAVRGAAPLGEIRYSELPAEAREMLLSISQGGPFRLAKDGSIFSNRERLLPSRPRGEYREYTVATPGLRGRGARRVVAVVSASGSFPPAEPVADEAMPAKMRAKLRRGDFYYTGDHYRTFQRIIQ